MVSFIFHKQSVGVKHAQKFKLAWPLIFLLLSLYALHDLFLPQMNWDIYVYIFTHWLVWCCWHLSVMKWMEIYNGCFGLTKIVRWNHTKYIITSVCEFIELFICMTHATNTLSNNASHFIEKRIFHFIYSQCKFTTCHRFRLDGDGWIVKREREIRSHFGSKTLKQTCSCLVTCKKYHFGLLL